MTDKLSAAYLAAVTAASALLNAASLNPAASDFQPTASVSHVAVKLLDFYMSDPEMWFTQADFMFRRIKISDSLTKYDYALQKLPCKVLQSMRELAQRVRTSDIKDPYEQLKDKLTTSYQKSPWQRTFELLDMPDLGDRRPSVLMDAMLALLPDDIKPNRLFLALFLCRLPTEMRDHLATQDLKTPAAMAAAANRLFDAHPQGAAVTAVISTRAGRSPLPARRNLSPSRRNDRRQQSSRCTEGIGKKCLNIFSCHRQKEFYMGGGTISLG
jgi:hypothetical protein